MKVRIAQAPLEAAQGTTLELARRLMRDKNWRATQLATALDKPPHVIRRCLRGERLFDIEDAVGIARLGGYSLDCEFELVDPALSVAPSGGSEELRGLIQQELNYGMSRIMESMGQALLQAARLSQAPAPSLTAALAHSKDGLQAQALLSLQSIEAAEERGIAAAPASRTRRLKQRGA
jgi:hypothetical protein